MTCEECEKSAEEQWPKGRRALRCFGKTPTGPGRVVNTYPDYHRPRTEPPAYCQKRKEEIL